MPAKQPGTNDAFSIDFTRPSDQAQEQAKSVFATQKDLLDALERMNEYWFARAKSEAELVTTVANKLASARSMPDLTSVYQDWLGQRMQRYVEDSNHVFDDVQKLLQSGTRVAHNGRGGS
jgi:Phasin protein